ncbi:MAG TPA: hypothetical protein DHV16_09780 [Nitrospiraceae bacterium]|nr:MAG: hypothetical protein A2Z82_04685 [Nitrospirae bacterium GWA2_46_11]OGW23705.1 MAG: hypothetical protein A2X55_06150 [Nitrospirae bacterium GWB2_47_37]HAK89113.1 hypothetical protein [Nitrospiraceae bacterium]HCL81629.1 hypothetical protein [Nitrospiraceae bacterium]HCZ12519.1 hypothetical protein [Nitrospiraceae bacterium]
MSNRITHKEALKHITQICFKDFISGTFHPHTLISVIRIGGLYLIKHIASLLYIKNNIYKGVEADLRYMSLRIWPNHI